MCGCGGVCRTTPRVAVDVCVFVLVYVCVCVCVCLCERSTAPELRLRELRQLRHCVTIMHQPTGQNQQR